MKEETLEDAAERYSEELLDAKTIQPHEKTWIKSMFIYVAKWQAERMYDVLENLWAEYRRHTNNEDAWSFKEWLVEQFKKK
jgi:hypothetical protein